MTLRYYFLIKWNYWSSFSLYKIDVETLTKKIEDEKQETIKLCISNSVTCRI